MASQDTCVTIVPYFGSFPISCLGMRFLKLQLPEERPGRSLQYKGSQAGALDVIHKYSRAKNAVIPAGIAGIQKPWMANSSMGKCLILLIFSPQFHIPVDWIPAIPAGMTGFHHLCITMRVPAR